jgi:glutamine synthetase
VFRAGDPDGVLLPTERGFLPVPWLSSPTALLPIWMFHEDGRPYDGDPRQALARVVDRYTALGLTPVVATELEFYLIDDRGRELRVPPSPRSGKRRHQAEILALRQLDAWDGFFTRLYERLRGDGHSRRHHDLGGRPRPVRDQPDAPARRAEGRR